MKKLILLLALALSSIGLQAQQLTGKALSTFNACIALRNAISSGSTNALRAANDALRKCETVEFSTLRPSNGTESLQLNGHFVWDEDFVSALIKDRKVRSFAQRYAENRATLRAATRGSSKVNLCTRMVKGKKSQKFTFVARDRVELAVVGEPKALITVRIHDLTNNRWYNDDVDVNRGRDHRIHVFPLPANKPSSIELEVINCSKKATSFAVICN